MADTFTTHLKARKPEQGAYPNAWATRINDDAIELLDDAIAGVSAINLGVSTTLTLDAMADGTDANSRAMRLLFTGTPASAVTITVPASVTSKLFMVDNDCGQALTIKYAATSGVTVSDGARAFVWADGTTVLHVATITSDEVGQTLNSLKRTAAEIAAGVTPTDYAYIDVRRFGVVGDGTTDDTAAFQRAIDVCQAGGFAAFIPRGITIRITSTIVYDDAKPCIILGEGTGGIEVGDARIKVDTGGSVGIKNDQGGGQKPLILARVGVYAATSSSAGHLVQLINVHHFLIDDCRLSQSGNHSADCIHIEGGIYFTLRRVRVGRARYGIAILKESGANASSGYVLDHISSFGESDWTERLIYIDGGEGVILQPDLSVLGSGTAQATFGLYIQKNATISEAGNILVLHADTEDTGGSAYGSGSRAIYVEGMIGVHFINPAIADSSANYAGIQFHDTDACKITGGFIDSSVDLSGTTRNFTIEDAYADSNYAYNDTSTGHGNRQIRVKKANGNQVSHGRSFSVTFENTDIAGTTAGENLTLLGSADCAEVTVPFACCIVGIGVAANDARTAGTATFEPRKNGSATGTLSAVLNGTDTKYAYSTVEMYAAANLKLAAGDRIGVRMVTSGWTPTTADVAVTLYLQE